jgi:hypothetical protein
MWILPSFFYKLKLCLYCPCDSIKFDEVEKTFNLSYVLFSKFKTESKEKDCIRNNSLSEFIYIVSKFVLSKLLKIDFQMYILF